MMFPETNTLGTDLEPNSQNAKPVLPKRSFKPLTVIETEVFPRHGPMLGAILSKL